MYICIFEDDKVDQFAPLSLTRGLFDLRVGAKTIVDLAARTFPQASLLLHTRDSVAPSMRAFYDLLVNYIPEGLDVLFINSRWVPSAGDFSKELTAVARESTPTVFLNNGDVVAAWIPGADESWVKNGAITGHSFARIEAITVETDEPLLADVWNILANLPAQLFADFRAYSGGYNVFERTGAEIHDSAILINGEQIFIEGDAEIRAGVILNADDGPIIIESGATVFERAVVRGPAYIGRDARVHVGANIHNVAIGPSSKVGGEIHDAIFHSYSNKAHDGFLGTSYIGQWCNLGAGTNNSNLKNDYGSVSVYDYASDQFADSGRQFVGLLMGDHTKCAIGTTFNTGSSVGVACNLFGSGFHPRMIPSFSWGGEGRYSAYRFEKAVHVAGIVYSRRGLALGEPERTLLERVWDESSDRREHFLAKGR